MKRKLFGMTGALILLVLTLALVLAGCASMLKPANGMSFYSDIVKTGVIRGEAQSRVWVGLFGKETFPTVERVAKENGITKIATVEHAMKPGVIWIDYFTIVTGE